MNRSLLSLHTVFRSRVRVLYRLAYRLAYWVGVATFSMLCAALLLFFVARAAIRPAPDAWTTTVQVGPVPGDLRGAYAAMLPLFVPALCLLAAGVFVPDQERPPLWYLFVSGAVMLGLLLVSPWLLQRLKAYQHNHYALASQHTRFLATVGMFYKLMAEVLVVYLALSVVLGVVVTVAVVIGVAVLGFSGNPFAQGENTQSVWVMVAAVAGFIALTLLLCH